ncbi:MAG: ABC transporter permease [Burkholderiaceae bacterium]
MIAGLVRKEWLSLWRDPHGLAALFLMPAVFIVVMSLALKDVYRPPLRELAYAVERQDDGAAARSLQALWERNHGPARPWPADATAELRDGRLKYLLRLQPGLSEELARPSLPTEARLELLAEPGIDAGLLAALTADLTGVAGEAKARLALARLGPEPPEGASMARLVLAHRLDAGGARPSAVQQNVPAWLVFGMFFVVASLANLFVQERASGTLARLRSLGVPTWALLLSKTLPYLLVNALQAALMLSVGVWLMPWLGGDALSLAGTDGAALLLALVAIAVAAVGLGLALAAAVRTHAQASAVGPIVNILMAAIGGIMVPAFVMPAFMQRLAAWSPMNWGLEALLQVLLRGGDAASTWPHAWPLLVFGVLMFLLAVLLTRPRSR